MSFVWTSASSGTVTRGPYWPLLRSTSSNGWMPVNIASGMEAGMQVVMDRLEDLVRESAQPDTNNAVRDAALQDTELRDAEMQATETQDASGREASR